MATLVNTVLTLSDIAKRLDPSGKYAAIVEMLAQRDEIINDIAWKEGNLPTGNQTAVRTGLPTVAWRNYNEGVQPSKSTTAQVVEQCAMLEGWHEVDKDLAELGGNVKAYRAGEASGFVQAMRQEFVSTLFYGNSGITPKEFTGLAPRYSTIAGATNGINVLSGGGAGSTNTSVWLVVWGPDSIFGIIPKGSRAGLFHEDLGLQTIVDANGMGSGKMRAYQDHWQWKCGIALKDWRYVVRIANIDVNNLVAKTSAADLTELMIKAIYRVFDLSVGKPVFYMNRTVMQMLDIQRRDDVIAGSGLSFENVDGKRIGNFRGIPLRICDGLLENEGTVS